MIVRLLQEHIVIEHNRVYTPVAQPDGFAFALRFARQETHLVVNGNLIAGTVDSGEQGAGFRRFIEAVQIGELAVFDVPDNRSGLVTFQG